LGVQVISGDEGDQVVEHVESDSADESGQSQRGQRVSSPVPPTPASKAPSRWTPLRPARALAVAPPACPTSSDWTAGARLPAQGVRALRAPAARPGRHPRDGRVLLPLSPDFAVDHRDVAAKKALLRERMAGNGWSAPRMLAHLDDTPDFYLDQVARS
jgi:hypothetical protein